MDVSNFDVFTTFLTHPLLHSLGMWNTGFPGKGGLFWPSKEKLLLCCCSASLVILFLHSVGGSGSFAGLWDMRQQEIHCIYWCVIPLTELCRSSACWVYPFYLFFFLRSQFLFHSHYFCIPFVFVRLFYFLSYPSASFIPMQGLDGWFAGCFCLVILWECRCFTVFGFVICLVFRSQAFQKMYCFWFFFWFWDV